MTENEMLGIVRCEMCDIQMHYNKWADYQVCQECIDNLPNDTGYCSLGCRLGYGCDGSC